MTKNRLGISRLLTPSSQFTNSKFQSLIFPLSFPSLALISQTLLFPFLLRRPANGAATRQGNHRRHSSRGKSCGASWGLDRRRGGVSTPLTQLPAKLRLIDDNMDESLSP
ncbi:hypothetical protein Tsubulata_048092 [Turnera subulata]|uniref:Uncharacterized protein n=1 Tax=Turnera subulata TaxID=218843 RepID=A0A9Q0FY25_9ROSI|nr:hypothetical protein Tsubulata_048092 [Turnera subulata]